MSETDWKVTEETSGTESLCAIAALSDDGDYSAFVKWDGCVDLHQEGVEHPDHLHICGARDLDAMIDRLTKLRELAREKFAEHWYGEWTKEET